MVVGDERLDGDRIPETNGIGIEEPEGEEQADEETDVMINCGGTIGGADSGAVGRPDLAEPRIDKCREQNPRRCDSLVQPSFEHSLRHCLPLNFFLIPFAVLTISPFV